MRGYGKPAESPEPIYFTVGYSPEPDRAAYNRERAALTIFPPVSDMVAAGLCRALEDTFAFGVNTGNVQPTKANLTRNTAPAPTLLTVDIDYQHQVTPGQLAKALGELLNADDNPNVIVSYHPPLESLPAEL